LIPFLDLAADFAEVERDARARIDAVLASHTYVLGEQTRALEQAVAAAATAAQAVACSSGTDALLLAMLALGIGPGDAVLVPAFTFFASAGAVAQAGAQPVFCDVEDASLLAGVEQMQAAIAREFDASLRHLRTGARLRAVMPVHLYGRMADMPAICALARSRGLAVVEDAAQAIGASMAGRAAGTWGDIGCLSFYPTKNLGGAGDGGMMLTNDEPLAKRLRRLRVHGAEPGSYVHQDVGRNARMSELNAAVLNAKLTRLEAWTKQRCRLAELYLERLSAAAAGGRVALPPRAADGSHVWHQLTVRIDERERVRERMSAAGIETRVFYPLPLHLQPCFAGAGHRSGDLPVCERAAQQVLSLPIHPSMKDEAVVTVCEQLSAAAAS
jgi:dTDP-4-amino-4,6-dideoxygalactose transaminase